MILLSGPPPSTTLGFVAFKREGKLGEIVGTASRAGLVMADAVGTKVGISEGRNCREEPIVGCTVDTGEGTWNLNFTEVFDRMRFT